MDGSNSKLCVSWELTSGRGSQFIQKSAGLWRVEGSSVGSYFGIMIPDASSERRVFHASFRSNITTCNRLNRIETR